MNFWGYGKLHSDYRLVYVCDNYDIYVGCMVQDFKK